MRKQLLTWVSWIAFLASAVGEWGLNIDLPLTPSFWLVVAVAALIVPSAHAAEITNTWINIPGGKWETNANWSVSDPSLNNAAVMITNAFGPMIFSKTIRIDALTVSTSPGSLIFSNLTISGPLIPGFPHPTQGFNELLVQNTGATSVHIVNRLLLTTGSVMVVSNSTMFVDGPLHVDGYMELDSGSTVVSTNLTGTRFIGYDTDGQMVVTGGTWITTVPYIGYNGGTHGLLTFSGGTITVPVTSGYLYLGFNNGASGAIQMSGGTMNLGLNIVELGDLVESTNSISISGGTWNEGEGVYLYGASQLNVSGGLMQPLYVFLDTDFFDTDAGTMTVSGGICNISQFLIYGGSTPGTIWLTGGQLICTNSPAFGYYSYIGDLSPGQMTVSNGVWLANEVDLGTRGGDGTLTIAGGTTTMAGQLVLATGSGTGTVWMTGGQLTVTNNPTIIGSGGFGQMAVSNGFWSPSAVIVGGTNGSVGVLTIAGGTNAFGSSVPTIFLGQYPGTTGTVWVTGGQLLLTNAAAQIGVGESGDGTLGQSNGVVRTYAEFVGIDSGSTGQVIVAGGTHIAGTLVLGELGGSVGMASVAGGQLITTNTDQGGSYVGLSGIGQMAVSAGSWQAGAVSVGILSGSQGTVTFSGGVTTMTNLVLGNCTLGTPGYMIVNSGDVFVTNAAHTATIDVRDGFVLMNGGQLIVDRLVITNSCGLFFHDAGTLSVGTLVLDPNLDADDDGLPNGWEQGHGLDPLSSVGDNGADGDPDHDGFSNVEEYQAGTDPQNFNSTPFRITSIVKQGNDVLVTWITAASRTNVLQFTKGAANGSYSNNFTDLSPVIIVSGVGLTSTNYLDAGAATNSPARYYRIRLVP